jgi:hypothetical protein
VGEVPAYRGRRDAERQARLDLIAEQTKSGTLTVRKLSGADVDELERARGRRLAVIVPVDDSPAAA